MKGCKTFIFPYSHFHFPLSQTQVVFILIVYTSVDKGPVPKHSVQINKSLQIVQIKGLNHQNLEFSQTNRNKSKYEFPIKPTECNAPVFSSFFIWQNKV